MGIGLAAAASALVNRRTVPRLRPHEDEDEDEDEDGQDHRSPWRRTMARPLAYAVVYFAAITAYFTYASEIARDGRPAAWTAPLLFAVLGVGGLVGLLTGRMARAAGTTTVGVASVAVVSGALVLLGLGRASLALVLVSALLLGVGYMVGSSLLAIWTAEAVPDRPGEGFTVALVVGAVVSIATPAVMGAVIPLAGLPGVLVGVAVLAAVGAAVLALRAPRRSTR